MAQAVTIVASGGIPVVSTTSPSARPVTLLTSGGIAVTPVLAGGQPVTFIGETGADQSLIPDATAYLKGTQPTYWFDFINNRALMNGVDVGTISAGVTLTSGTLALSAAGHTISSTANVLVLPVTLPYPFTVFAELVRTADSGFNERYVQLDDGTDAERAMIFVSAADAWRAQHYTASVSDFNGASGVTATLSSTFKTAARFQVNNMNVSVSGNIIADDTVCATNVNPTTLRIGAGVGNGEPATGIIRKLALITGGQANATLQSMAT